MKRRDFLKTAALAGLSAPLACTAVRKIAAGEKPARWFKGNIHAHSQWSDGFDLPEIVVDAYKNNGYDFFCLSDSTLQKVHSPADEITVSQLKDLRTFEGQTSCWKRVVPKGDWETFIERDIQQARDRFGADSVQTIETSEGKFARLKMFSELKDQFAEPDRFLLIPGFEMSARWVHVNCINVEEDFFIEDPDIQVLVGKAQDKAQELYVNRSQWLFMVNHPLWQYYNIQPSTFIARPNLRYLELTNNVHTHGYGDPEGVWTAESFFDIVNAHRAAHGGKPLYSTGTDDSHGIYRTGWRPFTGWMYVRSKDLTFPALFEAMEQGDSYCSTGLEFADISFDGKTLAVRIDPKEEGQYRIEFIGTKKDYDPSFKIVDVPSEGSRPARKIEAYSPEIGKVLETADGLEASYTLKPDDLYVRAKICRADLTRRFTGPDNGYEYYEYIDKHAAWTQAYFA